MFDMRKRIKALEAKIDKLEAAQKVKSFRYGEVALADVVKIIEKIPPDKPDGR